MKTGYVEIQKGVCDKCNFINSGEFPSDYKGFKRKRRFVCDHTDNDI